MPTPESEAAFGELVDARSRLNDISAKLNKAIEARPAGAMSDTLTRELQRQWDEAFKEFEAATLKFAGIVRRIREKSDSR